MNLLKSKVVDCSMERWLIDRPRERDAGITTLSKLSVVVCRCCFLVRYSYTSALNGRRRTNKWGVGVSDRKATWFSKGRVLPPVAVRPQIKRNKNMVSAEWPTFKK